MANVFKLACLCIKHIACPGNSLELEVQYRALLFAVAITL